MNFCFEALRLCSRLDFTGKYLIAVGTYSVLRSCSPFYEEAKLQPGTLWNNTVPTCKCCILSRLRVQMSLYSDDKILFLAVVSVPHVSYPDKDKKEAFAYGKKSQATVCIHPVVPDVSQIHLSCQLNQDSRDLLEA